ncbi:MAG: signal peptide peptidase SppA [Oscillospiraceae bacterium]
MKKKQLLGIIAAVLIFSVVGVVGISSAHRQNSLQNELLSRVTDAGFSSMPNSENIAVIPIYGTIGATETDIFGGYSGGYNHELVINTIDEAIDSAYNQGLFIDIDSGGGTVYHSDEVYLKLMEYKEKTGRPIYAYSNSMMASGAYYIACAADKIYSNRNATVGSIGVYISVSDYSALYSKLGIKNDLIRSGENKAMGSSYYPMTADQRGIYQGVVDECYNQFLDIVISARGYDRSTALSIADGRIYTASQGLSNNLIDKVCSYDEALNEFRELCATDSVYYPSVSVSTLSKLFEKAESFVPKSEYEQAAEFVAGLESGVPMYYAG